MYKIELRHYQTKDDNGQNYRWTGSHPTNLTKVIGGVVDVTTYYDATRDVLNLEELAFSWEVAENDQHLKQAISEEMEFAGASATFIKDWLVNRAYSPLNLVEVRVTDVFKGQNKLIGEFLIKPQKLKIY